MKKLLAFIVALVIIAAVAILPLLADPSPVNISTTLLDPMSLSSGGGVVSATVSGTGLSNLSAKLLKGNTVIYEATAPETNSTGALQVFKLNVPKNTDSQNPATYGVELYHASSAQPLPHSVVKFAGNNNIITVARPDTIAVTGVQIKNNPTLNMKINEWQTLVALVYPDNATNTGVRWRSDNTAIATVDDLGSVHAISKGTTTLTVITLDGGKTASCTVTVSETGSVGPDPPGPVVVPVTGLKISKLALALEVGKSEQLTATVLPANATNQMVTWRSSDTSVASVDAQGNITAIKQGSATITAATDEGNFNQLCTVTVKKPSSGGSDDPDDPDDPGGSGGSGDSLSEAEILAAISSFSRGEKVKITDLEGKIKVLSQAVLKALRDGNHGLVIERENYKWDFSRIEYTASDFYTDMTMDITYNSRDEISRVAFNFAHEGILPGRAAVSAVTPLGSGTTVKVMHEESKSGTNYRVASSGKLTFYITKCSSWYAIPVGVASDDDFSHDSYNSSTRYVEDLIRDLPDFDGYNSYYREAVLHAIREYNALTSVEKQNFNSLLYNKLLRLRDAMNNAALDTGYTYTNFSNGKVTNPQTGGGLCQITALPR